jgi:pyruvate dehydrogenase E2 component (dihydrolipoamide acetyltransferase)
MTATELVSVEVPDIGDFEDVPVIEVLVSAGDSVAAEDPLLTLESDKATMDVPAPFAGEVRELHVKVGDRVSQGTLLVMMAPADAGGSGADSGESSADATGRADGGESSADAGESSPKASAAASEGAPTEAAAPDAIGGALAAEAPESESAPPESESPPAPEPSAPESPTAIYASPSARRLARERGIDITTVSGSGRGGRITREDVEGASADGAVGASSEGPAPPAAAGPGLGLELAPWPSVNFEKYGPIERVPRSRIQKISAPNLARNWVMIPHVTHNDEADITELEAWRKQLNSEQQDVKVTMIAFLITACVASLKEFPDFNSSLDGDELILKRYYNIGFAADTPGGLVVPVIKDADKKGLFQIAGELGELSGKARKGKLMPADMAGSSFTISSLGGIGGTSFTPIVNAPEVAILGVTRSAMKPVWDGQEFVPRLMVPLSLSYDHRVIDGAAAARFVVHLVRMLSDLRRALL